MVRPHIQAVRLAPQHIQNTKGTDHIGAPAPSIRCASTTLVLPHPYEGAPAQFDEAANAEAKEVGASAPVVSGK